jgi:hypothetical protein
VIKIALHVNGRVILATLNDTEAAHAFAAMLPLTLTLHDLFGREKFGALPCAMPPAKVRTQPSRAGDILCWAAGPDLSLVHRADGKAVTGAFHVLGRIETGAEAFSAPGPLTVTVDMLTTPSAETAAKRRSCRSADGGARSRTARVV